MPRAGLNPSRVIHEAEQLADEVGLAKLTLAGLATRLGIRQPSLYKHLESLDALHAGIAIRAKYELADTVARAAVGRSRSAAVIAMAHSYRDWAIAHPGRYAAIQRASTPDDHEATMADHAVVDVVMSVLAGYQLTDDDAIDATRALRAALHGFVTLETCGGFGLPTSIDRSFDRLVQGLEVALAGWKDRAERQAR